MKVAHLLPNMVTGGRERIVADLCANAAQRGIEARLIAYDPHGVGQRLACPGLRQHDVDRAGPDFARRLADCLDRERIDVLHAQGHIAAALARPVAGRVPVVTTLHIALGGGWRWLPDIVRGLRASQAITAVSADLARRYRPLAGQSIAVIAPGVDAARFRPTAREGAQEPFTIGIAARLHPVKRHRDLIAAMHLLAARGVGCRLRIAGEGPLERDLRARSVGLDVRFDGHVEDMAAWLNGLDAFALVSDHEGTPLSLLEACSAGIPCIATDVGGIAAALGDAVRLVPRQRPAAIASAIESIADRGERWQRLRDAALRHADALSYTESHGAYARLYERVCR